MSKAISALIISDVHVLPKTIPNYHIVESIRQMLTLDRLMRVDALFITGDFWDRLINAVEMVSEYDEAIDVVVEILEVCKAAKTVLRVVKGTPFHDWDQSQWFVRMNKLADIGADVRYFDDVHLEKDPTLGVWIAYIPDAIRPDPKQVYDELVELMKTLGCDKIDYILAHGFFDFQNTYGAPAYDTVAFSEIVRYGIFCGHDHGFKQSLKVTVPGSFERLSHGDECPKGILESRVIHGVHHVTFIENKNAAWIFTKDLTAYHDDVLIQRVEEAIKNHCPEREGYLGKLRLQVQANTEHRPALARYEKKTPFKLEISYISDEVEDIEETEAQLAFMENLVPLTVANIGEQILDGLDVDLAIAERIISRVKREVKV